eukprot:5538274-Prymnesium_polylepis.1
MVRRQLRDAPARLPAAIEAGVAAHKHGRRRRRCRRRRECQHDRLCKLDRRRQLLRAHGFRGGGRELLQQRRAQLAEGGPR